MNRRYSHDIADAHQAKSDGVIYLHPTADKAKACRDVVQLRGAINPKTGLATVSETDFWFPY